MRNISGRFLMLTAAITLVAACTKKQPYEVLYKENIHDKSVIDTQADYLYLPSAVEADKNAPGGRPYFVGEEKLVRFKWAEKELQIVEIENDKRSENATNIKIVMTIPVEHSAFRCARDKYGECTNKEEAVNDVAFSQKGQFKPDMSAIDIKETSLLPIELENIFMGCYSQKHVELVGYNLTSDGLNLQLERTYEASPNCVNIVEWDDLKNLTFKARFNYSVVKLNKLATSDYQQVKYPTKDEGTFGFFTVEKKKLGVDNQDTVSGVEVLMKRWNPKRGDVVYHLSPAFAKPENKFILDATLRVVEKLNRGLITAKAGFQIKTEMPATDNISGDLRKSEIVLIEDPMKVGLLGYGPSVADPRTGEIVFARVAMYLGVMKKFIWMEYNALVEEKRAEAMKTAGAPLVDLSAELKIKTTKNPANPNGAGGAAGGGTSLIPNDLGSLRNRQIQNPGFHFTRPTKSLSTAQLIHSLSEPKSGKSFLSADLKAKLEKEARGSQYLVDQKLERILRFVNKSNTFSSEKEREEIAEELRQMDEDSLIALTGAYPAGLFNFQSALTKSGVLDDIVGADLKTWEELTDSEREEVLQKVMPIVWEATLIHEIGHTLGLRHNFSGSEDKDNFYSKEELEQMGVDRPIPYSSVMEYPYREMSALNTLGKYDIAALRFAYNREVETEDGQWIKLENNTLKDVEAAGIKLKEYRFCTDEHADANPNCNRFDEGSSLTEIAQNLVESAEKYYKVRNFRNGRRIFSLYNDGGYIAGAYDRMFDFRLFFERMSQLNDRFKLSPEDWENYPFLKDMKSATEVGLKYMLEQLTTPDTLCAVAKRTDPSQIVALVELNNLSSDVAGCFDPGLTINAQYVIVGQAGKSFQSRKASTNDNPYIDQIDVRGIWGDKIAALDMILLRRMGSLSLDGQIDTYLDNPVFGRAVLKTLLDLMLDEVSREITIEIPSTGQKLPINWTFSLNRTHKIIEPLSDYLAYRLGLANGITPFNQVAARIIRTRIPHPTLGVATNGLLNLFKVYVCDPTKDLSCPVADSATQLVEELGGLNYVAGSKNVVALSLIKQIREVTLLSSLSPESLEKVYKMLISGETDTSTLSPEEKAVYDLGVEKILSFARGDMKGIDELAMILYALAMI